MKQRIPALLLAVLLLLTCLPASALAEEVGGGFFYFSAETAQQLVVAPVRVPYSGGQTIREALAGSDAVALTTDGSNGFITAINGVPGNYAYGSDTAAAIDDPASGVRFFRFSEASMGDAVPSVGLRQLMQVMGDYTLESPDVQSAARAAYDDALERYPGVSSEVAASCAAAITAAITAYKGGQGTVYTVTFSGYSGQAYQITAENAYGKVFMDEGHTGSLSLPAGSYTFHVQRDYLQVSGAIEVSGAMTVSAALPEGGWFAAESFQLSSGYDADFEADRYACTVADHVVTTLVPDSFTGRLYPYVELTNAAAGAQLTAVYTDTSGNDREKSIPVKSRVSSIDSALTRGAQGSTVLLRASRAGADGYTQSEDLTLRLDRMPTLSALRVTDSSGTAQAADVAFSDTGLAYRYRIVATDTLKLYPTAADSSYVVRVNGQTLGGDGSAAVSISGDTDIQITVSGGGYTTTYTLHILPGTGKNVTFTMDRDTSIVVVNKNDEVLEPTKRFEGSKVIYRYTLVPGEDYSYVATKDTYYHAKQSFTLLDTADSATNLEVSVATEDLLTDLALGSSQGSGDMGGIPLSPAFSGGTHAYTAVVPDASNTVCLWATGAKGSIQAHYRTLSTSNAGADKVISISNGKLTGTGLTQALLPGSAYGNTVTVRVSYQDKSKDITYYTDYVVELERTLSLKSMAVMCQGGSVTMDRLGSESTGYHRSETAYSVLVPAAATSLELALQTQTDKPKYGDTDSGYEVAVNGQPVTGGTATVALTGDSRAETVTVTLTNRNAPNASTVYTITVNKAATTAVSFDLTPGDALVYVYELVTGNRVWPGEDGSFALSEGFTYYCSITRSGYVGRSGSMWVSSESGRPVLTFGEQSFDTPEQVAIALTQAPENAAIDPSIPGEWADFRGSTTNNGVTDAKTPISAEDGTLYWAAKLGDGYDKDAVGCPILVDGCLITYAGETLYRVDKRTGQVLATGTMAGRSSFAINNPTYSDGIILIGLSDGRIQAFNAETLESLWLYTDPRGGQPNTPITVCNGYAYTGFWNSEARTAAFVCLSLTDEDPASTQEAKVATWRHMQDGGFYWAGAYACESFVLVGTDDGAAECSYLYLFDPLTGAVLDSRSGLNGDIRSSVCYDETTNAYYFTTKKGSFYRARVEDKKITALDSLKLQNGVSQEAMSTSTPVVYNGRAYIGVCGSAQFGQYSGHNLTVIDLASWQIAYTAPTQGYPQTSGLLTTAYESSGYVYVYFLDNYTPGVLRVLRDKKGQTKAEYVTSETYKKTTYQAAYALFTPVGEQAQYAICSPIADSDGTLYFKNDSGYLMAFGSRIERLEVTQMPKQTTYQQGEEFSDSDMVVTATLANGQTRDVTDCVTVTGFDTAQVGPCTLTVSFPYVMYHNQANSDNTMTAGVSSLVPHTTLAVTVEAAREAETMQELTVSGDGVRVRFDGATKSGWRIAAAAYDEDGRLLGVTIQAATGKVTETLTLPAARSAAKVRSFVLNEDDQPQMEALSAQLGQ